MAVVQSSTTRLKGNRQSVKTNVLGERPYIWFYHYARDDFYYRKNYEI
jgi:hypothetical protein